MAGIYKPLKENIKKAADIIRSGGICAFPTETVYGLGGDAFRPDAAAKIFEAKKRPFFDPLISHISELSALGKLAASPSEKVMDIAGKFWPGPLTLVLKKSPSVPDIVTSGLETMAVRMPDHPVALELIREAGTPVAAPSANPFGCLSPTTAEHVLAGLGDAIEMILDGGPCRVGLESTIIKEEDDGTFTLLRPGGTPVEELEKITGPLNRKPHLKKTEAPGMLPYHYAPEKPVIICSSRSGMDFGDMEAAFLFFRDPGKDLIRRIGERAAVLSPEGDLGRAAAEIFAALHTLDKMPVKRIYAEAVPEEGLGLAIMDRIKKAAQKYRNQ